MRITCRDGGSRVVYEYQGRQSSERGVCDNDGACDGVCTFDFFPESVACNLTPTPPHENEGPGCPCYGPQSPCNERFLVPIGSKRRIGRVVRTFQQNFASKFVLRCRPARRRCQRTAATTTTLPGVPDLTGIWAFMMTGLDDTCPTGTTSPLETSIRIEATSVRGDTLALTQEWTLSLLGSSCPPCRMTWTGTMTRVPASP
jgi:hypothetical protein